MKEGYKNAKTKEDSLTIERTIRALQDSLDAHDNDDVDLELGMFEVEDTTYKTAAAYDSMQKLLPAANRDGWYEKMEKRRNLVLRDRYSKNAEQFWLDISNKFIHYFPYLIFVLLPLNALFFKLLYIRRKQFRFSDHSLFLIHIYSFMFMLMLLYLGILSLKQFTNDERLILTAMVILGVGCVYAIRGMKKFYEQGWGKTILKFILFNILCITALLAAFILVFSITISWI